MIQKLHQVLVHQSPSEDFNDVYHPTSQADDDCVLQFNTSKANASVNCEPKEAVSSAPGVMYDETGGTRRCNEASFAQFRGATDVEQQMATTHDHDHLVRNNDILMENTNNEPSISGLECTSVSLPVTCQAEENKHTQRGTATSYVFAENTMRIIKESSTLTAIIPPSSPVVASNEKGYNDLEIVPSKDHVSYVDIVRRKY